MIDTPSCFMLGKLGYTLTGGGVGGGQGGGGTAWAPPTDFIP